MITSLILASSLLFSSNDPDTVVARFEKLVQSIQAQGAIKAEDRIVLQEVFNSTESAINDSPKDPRLPAIATQLALWLGDNKKIDASFKRLLSNDPNNANIISIWASWYEKNNPERSIEIFMERIDTVEDSSDLRRSLAQLLARKQRYEQAIKVLQPLSSSFATAPALAIDYSKYLYNENRFQESIDMLESINSESVATNPTASRQRDQELTKAKEALVKWTDELNFRKKEKELNNLPRVLFVTANGDIEIELFEDHAPKTVANFISLAREKYFDGTRFHRVITGFMSQGGDPNSRPDSGEPAGSGGPGYRIPDETENNPRMHYAGTLSMANTGQPDSGGSQFFLCHLPTSHLDGKHTVFGRITKGLQIARELEKDDELKEVKVLRTRDHDYLPEKIVSE